MPTPAPSTTTPAVGLSWRSGWFTRRVMPGQEGVPVVHIPIQRDLMPLPRWCAFSPSIPGEVSLVLLADRRRFLTSLPQPGVSTTRKPIVLTTAVSHNKSRDLLVPARY